MSTETKQTRKQPSLLVATIGMLVIIAAIVCGIKFNFGTQMAVFGGAVVAVVVALILGVKWDEIQKQFIDQINGVTVANIIIIEVGILVGIWLIGGALPTLIHFGLGVISPGILLHLTLHQPPRTLIARPDGGKKKQKDDQIPRRSLSTAHISPLTHRPAPG